MIIEERGKTKEGFEYIIGVHASQGHRMGYIGVYPNSPLYSKCYHEDVEDGEEPEFVGLDYDVHVHGGLTFSGMLYENIIGGYNPHYFGFDCAHLGDGKIKPLDMEIIFRKHYTFMDKSALNKVVNDYNLFYNMVGSFGDNEYSKDRDYVRNECFHLSSQLKELEADYGDDGL